MSKRRFISKLNLSVVFEVESLKKKRCRPHDLMALRRNDEIVELKYLWDYPGQSKD